MREQQQKVQDGEEHAAEHETTLKELRNSRDTIEPAVHDAEIKLSELSVHLEHLGKDIGDKYGIDLTELPEPPDPDTFNKDEIRERLEKLNKRLSNIGEVNLGAAKEYETLEQRYLFLTEQEQDLFKSIDALQKVISKINKVTREKFLSVYTEINNHFKRLFPILFNGGKAYMELTDENNLLETGINIFAQPPGKKLQSLDLLSGGERALTVIALMFSIFMTKPSPFCLLDEIDAPLDDTNIGKFVQHLNQMAEHSQFIMVTHNKLSMQAADSLYGVTMEEKGVSRVVSVQLN
jgi:chromosome segregation protein